MTVTVERIIDLADRSARLWAKGDRDYFEDLKQEASIAGWRVVEEWPDAPERYVQTAIMHRLTDVRNGEVFGHRASSGTKFRPEMHAEFSDVIEDKYVGTCDEYPFLEDEPDHWAAGLIDALPEPKRTIMRLRYVDGMSTEDVREATGLTRNQVNIHHRWAKQALRERLGEAA